MKDNMRKQMTAQESDDLREEQMLRLGAQHGLVREAIRFYSSGRSVSDFREFIQFEKTFVNKRLGKRRMRWRDPY